MRVLGMMSGTSVDGIDAALVDFHPDGDTLHARLLGLVESPWPDGLDRDILDVLPPASSDVGTWCRLHARIGAAHAAAAMSTLAQLGPADLVAMHGQTLFHDVVAGRVAGTLQVGDASQVAAATGVPVVFDLRSADVAAGGQGAPLASILDVLWLGDVPTASVNLGGIANVTIVGMDRILAGDTGPANCLMDVAARREFDLPYDVDGAHAAAGRVDEAALARLLAEPYFSRPMPKSTGRELFHADWLASRLGSDAPRGDDLLATLAELTARTVVDALPPGVQRLIVAGGGARNPHLRRRLTALSGLTPVDTDELGIPTQAKECVLFALLGWLSVHGLPGVLVDGDGPVTGAAQARVLGSLTPPVPIPGASVLPTLPRRLVIDSRER